MQSSDRVDLRDFLDGLVTTDEDVAMLHRVRALDSLGPVEYLKFLEAFTDLHPPTREIPPHHEPFVL